MPNEFDELDDDATADDFMALGRKMAFRAFMERVDREIGVMADGLSHLDIDDYDYWSMYDSAETPQRTAWYALKKAGFPLDDDKAAEL